MAEPESSDPPISLLLVEDSTEDAELLLEHLTDAGLHVSHLRVDTPEAMARALANGIWDLVISDFALPRFNGLQALETLKASGIDIPFILVSGTIGEDVAVQAMKAGAHDFMAKGRLSRLAPAIRRELREAVDRRERRKSDSELRDMQEKLKAMGDAANEAMLLMDSRFLVSYWNHAAERLFGYRQDQALGHQLFDLIVAPRDRDELQALFREALDLEGQPLEGRRHEFSGRNRLGHDIQLEMSLSTVLLGGRWHMVGILRDITLRKALEREQSEQFQILQTVIEALPNPVFYKDTEGRYLQFNSAFLKYTGRTRAQLIGRTMTDFAPPDLAQHHQAADRKLLTTRQPQVYETGVTLSNGERGTVIESKAPVIDPNGRVIGIVGTMQDITGLRQAEMERARLEVQLRQAQKLEAIGQLAAGIAHEINTPIQFIGDNTNFLQTAFQDVAQYLREQQEQMAAGCPPDQIVATSRQRLADLDVAYLAEEIPKAIQQTLDGVARIARIVGAMKDFSHPGLESKLRLDLNHAIESTLIISHAEWKYVAEVETDLDRNLPLVPCFPSELNQVVLNLVVNAAHAIQEARDQGDPERKGRIVITTRNQGSEALIQVSDNGTGIPEAIQQRIFDPFFTTKPIGKGTGQGLAITHAVVVEKHKGRIQLESEPGQGTTFSIYLPMDA